MKALRKPQEILKEEVDVEVHTGQFPEGHDDEGKWAVQIVVGPFVSKKLANSMSDKLVPVIEGYLGGKALKPQ